MPDITLRLNGSRRSSSAGSWDPGNNRVTVWTTPGRLRATQWYGASSGTCSDYSKFWLFPTLLHELMHACVEFNCPEFNEMDSDLGYEGSDPPCEHYAIDTAVAEALCNEMRCIACALEDPDAQGDPDLLEMFAAKMDAFQKSHERIQEKYENPSRQHNACVCANEYGEAPDGSCDGCSYKGIPLDVPSKAEFDQAMVEGGNPIPDCSIASPLTSDDEEWCEENCEDGEYGGGQ